MRKIICLMLAAGLVAGALAGPAAAGKKKKSKKVKVHESFSASLAPWPKLANWGDLVGITKPGCSSGEEGVHWVAQPFTSPGKGTLDFYTEAFQGDWDIYIFDTDGTTVLARSEEPQVNTGDPAAPAPPEERIEFPMTKGDEVILVLCNWMGGPDNTAHYEGVFKA